MVNELDSKVNINSVGQCLKSVQYRVTHYTFRIYQENFAKYTKQQISRKFRTVLLTLAKAPENRNSLKHFLHQLRSFPRYRGACERAQTELSTFGSAPQFSGTSLTLATPKLVRSRRPLPQTLISCSKHYIESHHCSKEPFEIIFFTSDILSGTEVRYPRV